MTDSEEIIILEVMNEEGYCHVLTDGGEKKIMKMKPEDLEKIGLSIKPKTDDCHSKQGSGQLEWGQCDTKMLLDLYSRYLKDVGPMKRFKNKKAMWTQISMDIMKSLNLLRTSTQCESRYKTVLKRKTATATKNNQSGESPVPVEFESEIDKIKSLDDSVEPEVLWGIGQMKVKMNSNTPKEIASSSSEPPRKKKADSLSSVLYAIHQEKENNKDKRHQEKMNLIRELLQK